MSQRPDWIGKTEFNEEFELNHNYLAVLKSEKIIPSYVLKKIGKRVYVDRSYFVRRAEFRKTAQLYAQDMYYYLAEHFNDTQIAELVRLYDPNIVFSSMKDHISDKLFRINFSSIARNELNKSEWVFYKFSRFFARKVRVHLTHTPIDLDYILKRRM